MFDDSKMSIANMDNTLRGCLYRLATIKNATFNSPTIGAY
jgi:hypothetical protein